MARLYCKYPCVFGDKCSIRISYEMFINYSFLFSIMKCFWHTRILHIAKCQAYDASFTDEGSSLHKKALESLIPRLLPISVYL